MPAAIRNGKTWLVVLLFLVLGGVMVATVDDYGQTWDEPVDARYGEKVLDYFRTGGEDRSGNEVDNLRMYAPGCNLVAAVLYRHHPARKIAVRHGLSAALGWFTLLGLFVVGRRWFGTGVGALAVICLVLFPRYYGHQFANLKDVPFACALVWCMVALIGPIQRRSFRWPDVGWVGVATGALLSVRPAGLLVLVSVVAWIPIGWFVRELWRGVPPPIGTVLRFILRCGVALLLAWCLMVLAWPWAHERPVLHPLVSMYHAVFFPATYPVLFQGTVFPSDGLPRGYLPLYLLITTPVPILALIGAGLWSLRSRPEGSGRPVLLLLWAFVPIGLCLLQRPNVYDGIRQFLFLAPAWALLAAIGFDWLWRRTAWPLVRVGLIACLLVPVVSLSRLHPYQTVYFNGLVGGPAGAADRYELDYWLGSYREGAEWVAGQIADEAGEVTVVVAANRQSLPCAADYLPSTVDLRADFNPAGLASFPAESGFYIATTRHNLHRRFPELEVVYEVKRAGAVLTVVKATRDRVEPN